MKKYISFPLFFKSSLLVSSLCCYSQLCHAATQTVYSTADSGLGTLRSAIGAAGSGDSIVFSFAAPPNNTISLLSPLPPITNSINIGSITGASANIDGGGNFVFFAQSGNIAISNLNIFNAASIGGAGGANAGPLQGGGGGGGGLGAGAGLFVNTGASVVLTDVSFYSNLALGGTGATGFSGSQGTEAAEGGGGGGGGAFYPVAQGGVSMGGTAIAAKGIGGGGGGGGGAGLFPGGAGTLGVVGSAGGATGGSGGNGGGLNAGAGGAGGQALTPPNPSLWSGLPGQQATVPFNGGGGGGGIGSPFQGLGQVVQAGNGGTGADFGGGGGGGGVGGANPSVGAGGVGGFGGGGGGAGGWNGYYFITGGLGGFGGGGGGALSIGGSSVYAGGTAGSGDLDAGGGGGAGLGGAIFVRNGGNLVIQYSNSLLGPTAISGNSAIGGVGGGGLQSEAGRGYGQDIFINSGAAVTFHVDTPLTISSAIDSDYLNMGSPVTVQGSSILTLLGANTFNGGVLINQGGHLAVQAPGNLGIPLPGKFVTFDNGVLELIDTGFSWPHTILIGNGGGEISVTGAAGATFSGSLTGLASPSLGGMTISGSGITIFSGNNGYGGTTTIGPSSTLKILSTSSLPSQSPLVLKGGGLDLVSFIGPIAGSISGTGTIQLRPGTSPVFGGNNTYSGDTLIPVGATLGIATASSISPFSRIVNDGVLDFQHPSAVASPSAIEGLGSVIMDGAGVLKLSVFDTYSNGTDLNNGVVQISGGSALGSSGMIFNGGALELLNPFTGPLGATALLQSGGGTLIVDPGVSTTATGNFIGSGGLSITGGGALVLSGANTYLGNTTIGTATTVTILTSGSIPSSNPIIDQGLLQLDFPSGVIGGAISGSGGVSVLSGALTLQGINTYGGTTTIASGATLTIGSPSSFPLQSPFIDNGILTFNFSSPGQQLSVIGSSITGSGSVTVEQGVVTLGGTSTYGGTTTIAPNGTLQLGSIGALPSGATVIDNGSLVFQNTSGTAFPGPILGTGIVTMSGTGGRVVLTGTNLYSGGTYLNSGTVEIGAASSLGSGSLIFNGGTLELLNNPFTGAINATGMLQTPGGGAIQVDAGVVALYNGLITGPGSFAISGSGTLVLSALNNYTNTTLVDHDATLELTSILSLPGSSVVTDNGNLVFNLTAAGATVQNLISGSGVVTLTGPSQFFLQQSPNTYSGGTIISTGTLRVGDFSSIGSGPVVLVGGGTLKVTSSYLTPLSKFFILGSGGGSLQVDSGVNFSLLGPVISVANANLSIIGPGAMTFSGSNSSTGTTTIGNGSVGNGNLTLSNASFSGPLTVSPGAVLNGNGSMGSLSNNGSILLDSPGPYNVMTVTGDYTQSSSGLLQIDISGAGSHSQLNVSENLNLGGTLKIVAAPGAYAFGTQYVIVNAGNTISPLSSFSNVILPAFPDLLLTYNRDPNLTLTVISQSVLVGSHVHDHNPQQVFQNLQEIIHTPSSDLIQVISAMGAFNSEELTEAVNQLHPAQFGAFELLNANTSSLLASVFARHTAESCCLHLNQDCGCTNTSLWLQPFGYLYDQGSIGEQLGFNATAKGLAAGLNFCSTSGLLMGFGGAYSSSSVDWHQHRGHGSVDKASLSLYADYATQKFSVEASVIGSLDVFTASRHIQFSTIDRHARHQKGGYDMTAHLGIGRDARLGSMFLRPFLSLDYLYLYQKAFKESGAHSLDLSVKGRRSNMLRSEMGLSLTRSFHMGKQACFAPTVWVSGINEAYLIKRHYISSFVGESPSFAVRTFNKPIYLFSPGIDLSFMFSCGINTAVRYSAELNEKITTQKLDARFEWFF